MNEKNTGKNIAVAVLSIALVCVCVYAYTLYIYSFISLGGVRGMRGKQ